eukprot:g16902.t1
MGLGQFMPSSYRAYAAGYEEDGFIDIWTDTADAIWSVGNYLKAHGWKRGQDITARAENADSVDLSAVSTGLKPDLTVDQLMAAGVNIDASIAPDGLATLMQLEGEAGSEYWVGWHNFYVITRYNHSELYAMAVFQLAEAIREQMEAEQVGQGQANFVAALSLANRG